MRLRVGVIGVLLAVLVVFPAVAQRGLSVEESALLEEIEDAYSNMEAQTSFRTTSQQLLRQVITVQAEGTTTPLRDTTTYDQVIEGVIEQPVDDSIAAQFEIVQELDSRSFLSSYRLNQTIDMLVVDDTLYMRIRDIDPPEEGAGIPEGWVNLSEDPDALPGASVINSEAYIEQLISVHADYPLVEETIASITEMESETIDGQPMRVLEIAYDMRALVTSDATEELSGVFDLSQFGDLSQLGLDIDSVLQAMGETGVLTVRLWITPDNLIHRSDAFMSFALTLENIAPGAESALFEQEVSVSSVYSDLGEDFDITAPETGE